MKASRIIERMMPSHELFSRSLQLRVTLLTLLVFLLGTASLSLYVNSVLRADVVATQGRHQLSAASYIAADIDLALRLRMQSLELASREITGPMLDDPAALRAFLDGLMVLQSLFNSGTCITGPDGIARAASTGRSHSDYLQADAVRAAMRDGKPRVGAPVLDRTLDSPVFAIAVPVFDAQGRVIGALAGVTSLLQPNFLDHFSDTVYGETGYFVLADPASRLVVTATDKSRILEQLPPAGSNPVIDRHLGGREESVVMSNPFGVQVLATAKRVAAADWVVVAGMPVEEALAAVNRLQQRIVLATTLLALLAGALIWYLLRRQLQPLKDAASTLSRLSADRHLSQPLPVA
jgi:hypothetical protein